MSYKDDLFIFIERRLEEIAHTGTPKQFKAALLKHRGDAEALSALKRGWQLVDESYPNYQSKEKIFEDFKAHRGAFAKRSRAKKVAANTNKEPSLTDIFTSLQSIEKRLDALEEQRTTKRKSPRPQRR